MSQAQSTVQLASGVAAADAADAVDDRGCAYFWKGRVALYAILRALGIGPGDAVVVPGYTCVVVPTAVQFAGAKPLFADIDPATYNVTLERVEAAAGAEPVKAVVVQHTYGIPAEVGPIARWAQTRGISLIEDCCHAQGSRYRERDALSAAWQEVGKCGDAAFYSSQWSKPFTTGLGGWATARDPQIQDRLRRFAAQECVRPGFVESSTLTLQLAMYRACYRPALYWAAQDGLRMLARAGIFVGSSEHEELDIRMPVGYAKRMPWLQRQIAARGIGRIDAYVAQRRAMKAHYDEVLRASGMPTIELSISDPVLLRYPIRVNDKSRALAEARRRHIELGDWFDHPLHPRGANVTALGWREGICPQAERAADEVVNLPMHARVRRRQVERGVEFVRQFQL